MAAGVQKRASAKFYQEDLVRRKDDPSAFGVVVRCWQDAEDLPPPSDNADPLMRALVQGEVGVSYYPRPSREILSEDDLELVDRTYQPGDLLKRSIDAASSGVVTSINVKGRLEHAVSNEPLGEWKSGEEVESAVDVDMGDYVLYNDWVGQVVEMFDEALVEMSQGNIVRLPELSARLAVGEKGPDILPQPLSSIQGLFGFILGSTRPSSSDTVVAVKHTVLAVAWLAINQALEPSEAQTRQRPPRFWHGQELGKLTLVRRRVEEAMRVGDRVVLKGGSHDLVTRHGKDTSPQGVVEVRTLVVQETHTTVNVLWQDGTIETLDAKDTVPYLNPDEYDCWPGDQVLWKTEDEQRAVIVQTVNALDRTAQVRVIETGATELASVLELDPHGSADWSALTPNNDGLGVRRGDFVLIHRVGTTNGATVPMVPRIGEVEEWVREAPIYEDGGEIGGWRREMTDLGASIAECRGKDPALEEAPIKRPHKDDNAITWFGEVMDLRLDGSVDVVIPDGTVQTLPLERLTRLYDGLDQLEDLWGDDDDGSLDEGEEDVEVWEMDEEGHWVEGNPEEDGEWSTDEEEGDADAMEGVEEGGAWSPSSPTVPTALPDADDAMVVDSEQEIPHANGNGVASTKSPDAGPDVDANTEEIPRDKDATRDELPWKRFDILPSAPPDHAFYASAPAQPSRSFLGRLSKEYKALTTSLPDSIVVRAFEDRSDLLRCLIIGPDNTPYQDAPFVIDWMLDSNFPQTPPIAHFLSWTNGNGRVNPNLYEEGKVCLSILGTWAGDKSESWSPSRSSLLQALVSIQGLVLVKEPWFCEPAYEKLRGTEDGIVNSRLYSEKAYVLSRGFVRRALEIPLGGLESEIQWFYHENGRLKKVVDDARALIEKSKVPHVETDTDGELAVPRLTGGGIITLERTLAKLQALLDAHS